MVITLYSYMATTGVRTANAADRQSLLTIYPYTLSLGFVTGCTLYKLTDSVPNKGAPIEDASWHKGDLVKI